MSTKHSDLAKALLGLAVDVAAPGVRGKVEEIIKMTRDGVDVEGGDPIGKLLGTEEFENYIEKRLRDAILDWGRRPNSVPLTLRQFGIYQPDGLLLYGPAKFPSRVEFDYKEAETTNGPQELIFKRQLPAGTMAPIPNPAENKTTSIGESPTAINNFKFGSRSESELKGVKPELVAMARLGLKYSKQDFGIYDGLRTEAEQREYVKAGTSMTMESKHRPQEDGLAHALDAVPWENGAYVWDWDLIYPIVMAMDRAATELGFAKSIVWGGAWDRRLSDFGGDPQAYMAVAKEYVSRQRAAGKKTVFIDGPHFEWRN